jgi:hypothetical protein
MVWRDSQHLSGSVRDSSRRSGSSSPAINLRPSEIGIAASKEDWPQFGAALVVIVAGVVAAFVGPSGAWLAAGIGLFVAVEGYALTTGWLPIHAR